MFASFIFRWRQQVNQQQVLTFLTAGNIKFMLLHGGKSEESIRSFFQDVYELYVKVRVCRCCLLLSATLSHATNIRAGLLPVTVDFLWYCCAITGAKDLAESDEALCVVVSLRSVSIVCLLHSFQ